MKLTISDFFKKKGNFRFYIRQYCCNSSINGLNFLGEPKRYLVERIWWLLFLSVSLFFCTTLIWDTYKRWMTAPVIVSFATSATQIWEIPFPAVTICPFIRYDRNKYDWNKELEMRGNESSYDAQAELNFRYMSLVCPSKSMSFSDENSTETVTTDVIQFLIDVAVDFNFTVHSCKWMGHDCSDKVNTIFTPMLTREGICYTLNMLNPREIFRESVDISYYDEFINNEDQPPSQWTIEKGYVHDNHIKSYPLRTVLSGPAGGIDLKLYTRHDDIDHRCSDSLEGFKVLLHHPAQIPRTSQRFFWVSLDEDVVTIVKPNMMTTSNELRSYRPIHRKCFFTHERSLKYFKIYNQQNCILECLTNYTFQSCNCVHFSMPRDNSTPICGPAMLECMANADYMFMINEASIQVELSKVNNKSRKYISKTDCVCLQACHTLTYDIETSQMRWNWSHGNILKEGYQKEGAHMTHLRIFYKDLQFMTSERNELFGQTDFWANCGGLLGLFTGFSFISLIEILYFVTLRLVCNIKMYGFRNWSGSDELINVAK